ncbi:M57 family metalloprotease [Roseivirga sp. BDSF3-8]|uniref:M57 family metalloprotease n=1 Tax=Roseivirga sp. BDSF3-8 TaxID=3241598 RepID=UPI003531ACA2
MKIKSLCYIRGAIIFLALVTVFPCLTGCESPEEVRVPEVELTQTAALDHILSLDFSPDRIEEFPDFYLVEGDILFYKDDYAKDGPSTEQASTNALISRGNQNNVTVRIDGSMPSGGADNWRPEIQQAINDWNSVGCSRIRLVLTTSSTADITIRSDFGALGNNVIASASFPSNGNPGSFIQVNFDFLNNTNVSSGQKRYNMVHEFGHCLGFRHTNWAGRNEGVGTVGANYIPQTPVNDSNSIMNGGTALNSWVGFSSFDVKALQNIYPALNTTCPAPFYRYFGNGNHFYTTDWSVFGSGRSGYNLESIQCRVFGAQASGTVPLYRYYNASANNHFFTTNFNELGSGRAGYNYEGVQAYVYPNAGTGRVPLYRYFLTGSVDHFYTTNFNELGNGGSGVIYEGIACYVLP